MAFLLARSPLNARQLAARPDPAAKVLPAREHAALIDAQALLAQARSQADAILAGAQAAFEAECRRGYAEGREQALMQQSEKMIETVSHTVDHLATVESQMIELVMIAVRKILDDFDDREKIIIVVRNALAVLRNQKQMTLRLHPDNVDAVRSKINDLLAAYPGVGYLDIVGDGRLAHDACILESEIGVVEASIEGQMQALHNAFERMLGSRV